MIVDTVDSRSDRQCQKMEKDHILLLYIGHAEMVQLHHKLGGCLLALDYMADYGYVAVMGQKRKQRQCAGGQGE